MALGNARFRLVFHSRLIHKYDILSFVKLIDFLFWVEIKKNGIIFNYYIRFLTY